jgi:hypothetical protein
VITKRVLWGLIVVTTVVFSLVYAVLQQPSLAVFAAGLGLLWLSLEVKRANPLGTVFFVSFLALAIVGSLISAPILIILLGLSTDLAAWDLSRFRTRIASEIERGTTATLEAKHLRMLAVTASAGFFVAVPTVFIHVAIGFIVFGFVTILAMITLRRSALYFRSVHKSSDSYRE